jgi:beta-1,4-mannosyl-glycoprotein beta-1,4-N-acetylglucosaminyltransferase
MIKSKFYDTFLYSGESDLFNLRYKYLRNQIDYFVVIEGEVDFQNHYKGFNFFNEIDKYVDKSKIIYHQIKEEELLTYNTPSKKEFFSRNSIKSVLKKNGVEDDDIIIISDIDEIPNFEIIEDFDENRIYYLEQLFLYFYINYVNVTSPFWSSAFISKYSNIKDLDLNEIRFSNLKNSCIIKNAGWHFSYLGGVNTVFEKLNKLADNVHLFNYMSIKEVEMKINKGVDLFNRDLEWGCLKLDDIKKWNIFPLLNVDKYFLQNKLLQRKSLRIKFNIFLISINKKVFSFIISKLYKLRKNYTV